MSFIIEHLGRNVWRGKFSIFPEDEIRHGLSARLGGVSAAPWDSLNMGLHVGDNPEHVWQNRERFLSLLELKAERLCSPEQVHGTQVHLVLEEEAGRGAHDYGDAIPQTDALITNVPGLPLFLCFADCTPLLFYDPENHAVGVAHAGWKGTAAGIAIKMVVAMQQAFGSEPAELLASIGPAIGPCCYEINEDVEGVFNKAWPDQKEQILQVKDGGMYLDLREANRHQLLTAGVVSEHIDCAENCTSCDNKWFFSYRADGGQTGRLAAVIALREY